MKNKTTDSIRTSIISDSYNVFPNHRFVKSWYFSANVKNEEECEIEELHAEFANAMAKLGEKLGLDTNDIRHMFPMVLRMMKSNSEWSK
jgi:hypothetical protein